MEGRFELLYRMGFYLTTSKESLSPAYSPRSTSVSISFSTCFSIIGGVAGQEKGQSPKPSSVKVPRKDAAKKHAKINRVKMTWA